MMLQVAILTLLVCMVQNLKVTSFTIDAKISRKRPSVSRKPLTRLLASQNLPCDLPLEDASMHLLQGRRCLLVRARKIQNRNYKNAVEKDTDDGISPPPPIIILGGMAQCIESWQHHFADFSRERDVMMYEYLGQGQLHSDDIETDVRDLLPPGCNELNFVFSHMLLLKDYYRNVGLEYQASEFEGIVRDMFDCEQFDVIAFSLGARITLATIARNPSLIRKAHLTGVSAERDTMGKIIFASWKDLLSPLTSQDDDLRAFSWSIIMATYSQTFLAMNGPDKISSWVDHICSNNRRSGLFALVENTSSTNPIEFSEQIRGGRTLIQLAVGGDDIIAPIDQVRRLNTALGLNNDVIIYKGCGHAVLNEHARPWRKDALTFLNE